MRPSLPLLILYILCGSLNAAETSAPAPGSLEYRGQNPESGFVFTPEQVRNRFIGDFIRWASADDGNLPRPDAILAVGSSSMRMWSSIEDTLAPVPVIHRGFGGSRMSDVLLFEPFFDRYEAGRILIYEGDNDLASPSSDPETDFLNDLQVFMERTWNKRPETEFFLIAAKPSPRRVEATERFATANATMEKWAEKDPRVHFIDVFTPMMTAEGKPNPEIFSGDQLHMNEEGYAIWNEIVREAIFSSEN